MDAGSVLQNLLPLLAKLNINDSIRPNYDKYPGRYADSDFAIHDMCRCVYYDILGWCGCGLPEESFELVGKALKWSRPSPLQDRKAALAWKADCSQFSDIFGVSYVTDSPIVQAFFYTLDKEHLIEHGTSINQPYRTSLGECILQIYELWISLERPGFA